MLLISQRAEEPDNLPQEPSKSKMVSSFYFMQQLRILIKYATILGHHDDAERYSTT